MLEDQSQINSQWLQQIYAMGHLAEVKLVNQLAQMTEVNGIDHLCVHVQPPVEFT